jgi:glycosyltransferase involved in cell wall biosynthesis
MSSIAAKPRRRAEKSLGVYQDGPFTLVATPVGPRLAPDPVDAPFLRFVVGVADHFDELTVFARVVDNKPADSRLFLPPATRVVELPDYGSLRRLGPVARSTLRTAAAFWRGLDGVDVVWAFGPHPFQLMLVAFARLRRKRVVLGVRQDTPAYFRARLPSRSWRPLLVLVAAMDATHRCLARRMSATVVGESNADRYGHARNVLSMMPSLVHEADVVAAAPTRDWKGEIELLTVGRIDAEKNPAVVVDAVAALNAIRPGMFRLRWIGDGPLAEAVRQRAVMRGVGDRIELIGYIPFGPELLAAYRHAHVFVHVSLTEGVPQVLVEAFASGTPVVATDVGSVRHGVDGGRSALLVPPSLPEAIAEAVLTIVDDADVRDRLVTHGLETARARTFEAEAARVANFITRACTSGGRLTGS